MKSVEIISMIYKSKSYLKFTYDQLKSEFNKVDGWEVNTKIIANDPTPTIVEELKKYDINYEIYHDKYPDDYYLNRVYRCFNHAGKTSKSDYICFIGSDMAFSKDWLKNLLKYDTNLYIPCSRLIESGKMPSAKYAISGNLGQTCTKFESEKFLAIADQLRTQCPDIIGFGGLYMPVILEKKRFVEAGMYPEGNIYTTGIGTRTGNFVKSSDTYFYQDILERKYNMKHITVFDSIVYHIQEGEKDE